MANQSLTDLDLTPPSTARLTYLRYTHRVRDLIEVARLHRPIGIWLLLWPVLWAVSPLQRDLHTRNYFFNDFRELPVVKRCIIADVVNTM